MNIDCIVYAPGVTPTKMSFIATCGCGWSSVECFDTEQDAMRELYDHWRKQRIWNAATTAHRKQ